MYQCGRCEGKKDSDDLISFFFFSTDHMIMLISIRHTVFRSFTSTTLTHLRHVLSVYIFNFTYNYLQIDYSYDWAKLP